MKTVVVTSIFPPETRGPAIYCYELAKRLKNTSVITFTFNPIPIENTKIISIPQSGGPAIRQTRLFLSILRSNPDLIYAQGADVVGLASVIAGKILRKPVVIKFVGDLSVEMERDFGKKVKYLSFVTKLALSLASKIIFPAQHLRQAIIAKYKINPSKTVVIYNAVG
ncbi:MAG: glycosyltransferase [Patescibacteria group bacterium]|mgnify:CR=1 FL=1